MQVRDRGRELRGFGQGLGFSGHAREMESSALSLSFLLKCVCVFGAQDNAGNWGFILRERILSI